eukprot:8187994-Alexandrium_andersonii.AAC.1
MALCWMAGCRAAGWGIGDLRVPRRRRAGRLGRRPFSERWALRECRSARAQGARPSRALQGG